LEDVDIEFKIIVLGTDNFSFDLNGLTIKENEKNKNTKSKFLNNIP